MRNWWAVVPSSSEQQVESERIPGAQDAVARGKAAPHNLGSAGILILAVRSGEGLFSERTAPVELTPLNRTRNGLGKNVLAG